MTKTLDRSIVDTALCMSPEPFLRHYYGGDVKVTAGGRSISVRKVLRADKKTDGKWVSCTWVGEGIGDNIKLMNFLNGAGFVQAVEELTGQCPFSDNPVRVPTMKRRTSYFDMADRMSLNIPQFITDSTEGHQYLESRGLSPEIIMRCEENKTLAYTADGVCFLGRNSFDTLKYIAHRYYKEQPVPDSPGETRNKKDEFGSSKIYCFSIPPKDEAAPFHVFIVEGAINAMAQADFNSESDDPAIQNAAIFTTGGVASRMWLSRQSTQDALKKAVSVTMIGENEGPGETKTREEKQQETDRSRHAVLEYIEEKTGVTPRLIYPPEGCGDVADHRLAVVSERKCQLEKLREAELHQTKAPGLEVKEASPSAVVRRRIVVRPQNIQYRRVPPGMSGP